jgi:hypothetical protein
MALIRVAFADTLELFFRFVVPAGMLQDTHQCDHWL